MTLNPPQVIRFIAKGHVRRVTLLHHLHDFGVDAIAVRARLLEDVGEHHGLAGLQLHPHLLSRTVFS